MNKSAALFPKDSLIADRYRIQFFLRNTIFGKIYRAKNPDGELVQLKIYNASKLRTYHFSENGELVEFQILCQIQHPNIVEEIDSGEFTHNSNVFRYITSQFVSGESLEDKLKREGPFSPYSAVPILIELLKAISYLHSLDKPILHNGIGLQNVLLDYSENREKPILVNFSNAFYFGAKDKNTAFDGVLPFYLAPEVYNKVITPQSDVFAAGALLYHLIFGIPPWHTDIPPFQYTDKKLLASIEAARLKPLNFSMADDSLVDEHLQNTLHKALAMDVDIRFKTADEFSRALSRELDVDGPSKPYFGKSKSTFTPTDKKNGFSEIAGMQELKDLLYNDVIRALNEKDLYESYGITIPNGMLLYGPPGCGKTFISERFAEEIDFNFTAIKPSDLASIYVHGTQEKIGMLFKNATDNAPSVIFIDEVDAIVPSRDGDLQHSHASEVNEILAQMTNCSEKGIFIIAATNRPDKIDPALLRTGRIDRMIYLSPPDKEARKALFTLYLKDRYTDLGIDYDKLANITENYVTSDIKFLVDEASRRALQAKSRITQEIFEDTISNTSPSVSLTEIRRYEAMKATLEGARKGMDDSNKKPPIGFR